MFKTPRRLIFSLALSMAALSASTAFTQDVTGDSVTIVEFGENGVGKGMYRQTGPGQWQEVDEAGNVGGTFDEVSRDSETVVIEDAARGISVTLDLANSVVTFGPIGETQDPLYEIVATGADPVGAAAPKAAAAPAGPRASGLTVVSVIIGNNGTASGEFRQTGKSKWRELDAQGNIAFKFDEVNRDRGKVELEDRSRSIALTLDIDNNIVTYGAIGGGEQSEIYEIMSSTAREVTAGSEAINDYIASLRYDPRLLLREVLDGSTTTQALKPGRVDSGSKVVITTANKQSFDKEVESISVLKQLPSDIFPGALVVADGLLVDGNPRPSGLPRGPLTLSLSLQGGDRAETGTRLVTDPKKSTVKIAVDDLVREWQATAGDNTNPDSAVLISSEIYDLTHAQAELEVNAKWASGAAEAMLKGSGSKDRTSYVAMYKQIFYSISVDTPAEPSAFFANGMTVDKVARDFTNDGPPAYVDSITYGRILLVKMDVDNSEVTAEMKGKFEQTIREDDEVSATAAGELEKIAKSARFSAITLGGKSDQGIFDSKDLSKVQDYIANGATYSAKNPGLPIEYSVKFLKDNTLATIRLAGEYTYFTSVEHPYGFVKMKHTGGMLGRWRVTWTVEGVEHQETNTSWPNGDFGPTYVPVPIPGDARNVRIKGELARLVNDAWQIVVSAGPHDGPNNHCYWIYGTSFFEKVASGPAPGDGDDCKQ
jgi:thiol-activated cytolysin